MRFFFDESGSFCNTPNQERFGVVVGVAIPESSMPVIESAYNCFAQDLPATEKHRGEPKGKSLTERSRMQFANMISSFKEIKIIPTVLSIGMSDDTHLEPSNRILSEKAIGISPNYVHAEMRSMVETLGRQIGNLGTDQLPHLFTVARSIRDSLQSAIINFASNSYRTAWHHLDFEIDQTTSRGVVVFEKLLTLWLPAWAQREPIVLIKGVHEPGHPLIDLFWDAGRFEIRSMIANRIRFVNSRDSFGVQIADIASNTILRALRDLKNLTGSHAPVISLLCNTILPVKNPIGLFGLGDRLAVTNFSDFRLLIQAIHKSKH